MQLHKLELHPTLMGAAGQEAKVEGILREIEREKKRRATLELELAQLLREQRLLLFSTPSPRDSAFEESPPSSPPCAIAGPTRRRRDNEEAKMKRKRTNISNKLINLDYMLKRRTLAQRQRNHPAKRTRVTSIECQTRTTSKEFAHEPEDHTAGVGSTSPRDQVDPQAVERLTTWSDTYEDEGCTPPSSSPPPVSELSVRYDSAFPMPDAFTTSPASSVEGDFGLLAPLPTAVGNELSWFDFLSSVLLGTDDSDGVMGDTQDGEDLEEGFDLSLFLNSPSLELLAS